MAEREDREPEIPGEEADQTSEVGSEGGSFGDVEIDEIQPPSSGSEASETKKPEPKERVEIRRDETGVGRRSPIG
jgi:hypothetical protein